jgi:hypothetical protein
MDKTDEYFLTSASEVIGRLSGDKDITERVHSILVSAYELGKLTGELNAKQQYLADLNLINKDSYGELS